MKSVFMLHYVCVSLQFSSDKYGTLFPNREKSALYWECRNFFKCSLESVITKKRYLNVLTGYFYKWSSVETYSV